MKRGEIAQQVSRGAFFLALEKAAALVSGMVYFALLLRWLGPTNYGIIVLAQAIPGFAIMATGNFEVFLERYAAEFLAKGRSDRLMRSHYTAVVTKTVLGLLVSGLLLVVVPMFESLYHMPELAVLLPLLTVTVAVDGLASTGRSLLVGMQRYPWVSGISLLFHIGKTLAVGWLWWNGKGLVDLAWFLAALAVLQALMFALAAAVVVHRERQRGALLPSPEDLAAEKPVLQQMVGYCLPLLGARAAFLSGQNFGKMVLAKVLNATELGYFTFAFQTVERFVELMSAASAALLPSLTTLVALRENERLRQVFDQAFRLVQVAAMVTAWALFAFAPDLTLWIGSPMFLPATRMLRILALVPIVRTAHQPLTMLFQAMRRPDAVFNLAWLKLGVEMACYFLVVRGMGGVGAAAANLLGAVLAFGGALLYARALVPETAWQRFLVQVRAYALLLPMLLLAWWPVHVWHTDWPSVVLRVLLIVPGVMGLFALQLVTREDLARVAAIEIASPRLRRLRDLFVSAADALARPFEPRRTA